jgi:hypothetical protein
MSSAIGLYKQDGTAACAFYCSECRAIFQTEEEAANCHSERLCACGGKLERFYATCASCRDKEWREKEAVKERERFAAAAKITEAEYGEGMVYHADNYYESVEDAIDGYLEGQEPEYVWACKDIGVIGATTESLYENMLDNMWDDADVYDLNGVNELEAAVTAFNEANKNISVWEPDYSTAILVHPTPPSHS